MNDNDMITIQDINTFMYIPFVKRDVEHHCAMQHRITKRLSIQKKKISNNMCYNMQQKHKQCARCNRNKKNIIQVIIIVRFFNTSIKGRT